jgi:hypothetical protein
MNKSMNEQVNHKLCSLQTRKDPCNSKHSSRRLSLRIDQTHTEQRTTYPSHRSTSARLSAENDITRVPAPAIRTATTLRLLVFTTTSLLPHLTSLHPSSHFTPPLISPPRHYAATPPAALQTVDRGNGSGAHFGCFAGVYARSPVHCYWVAAPCCVRLCC